MKKRIYVILCVALFCYWCWYVFPVVTVLFFYEDFPDVITEEIELIVSSKKEEAGDLVFSLPFIAGKADWDATSSNTYLYSEISGQKSIWIILRNCDDLDQKGPTYNEGAEVFSVTPQEISIFKTRKENVYKLGCLLARKVRNIKFARYFDTDRVRAVFLVSSQAGKASVHIFPIDSDYEIAHIIFSGYFDCQQDMVEDAKKLIASIEIGKEVSSRQGKPGVSGVEE